MPYEPVIVISPLASHQKFLIPQHIGAGEISV